MTGSALILALKLVVRHDELENVNHGVLRDALVVVVGIQILLHNIKLRHYLWRYQGVEHPPPPLLDKNNLAVKVILYMPG